MVIKWTNKVSGDTGYVGGIDTKERHFINADTKEDAKHYTNKGLAKIDMNKLHTYGEDINNEFAVED